MGFHPEVEQMLASVEKGHLLAIMVGGQTRVIEIVLLRTAA
jgi:hypothetical protein